MLKKCCSRCRQEKLITEFWLNKHQKDGHSIYCSQCAVELERKYWERDKPKYLAYASKNRLKTKLLILTHYGGGKCACLMCGENRLACLTIDHIKGGGRKHRQEANIYGRQFYQWLKNNKFPGGYQTLCANCQLVKRVVNGECPGNRSKLQ